MNLDNVKVRCANKLCSYEGRTLVHNYSPESFAENKVCPKCGFKTIEEWWKKALVSLIESNHKNFLMKEKT